MIKAKRDDVTKDNMVLLISSKKPMVCIATFSSGRLKERNGLGNVGVNEKIVFKMILRRQANKGSAGLNLLTMLRKCSLVNMGKKRWVPYLLTVCAGLNFLKKKKTRNKLVSGWQLLNKCEILFAENLSTCWEFV